MGKKTPNNKNQTKPHTNKQPNPKCSFVQKPPLLYICFVQRNSWLHHHYLNSIPTTTFQNFRRIHIPGENCWSSLSPPSSFANCCFDAECLWNYCMKKNLVTATFIGRGKKTPNKTDSESAGAWMIARDIKGEHWHKQIKKRKMSNCPEWAYWGSMIHVLQL